MTDSRRRFEEWFSGYVVQRPLLAARAEVLPGLSLHDLALALAEEAWEAAQKGEVTTAQPVLPAVEAPSAAPPLHLVESPAPAKRRRGGAGWSPEQREAQAERMRERWRTGKGVPYRRTMTDGELDAVTERAKSHHTP